MEPSSNVSREKRLGDLLFFCFFVFLILLGEPCLSVDRRVTDDGRI